MKKIMLSMLALALAASASFADGTKPVKVKTKQATCTKCTKAEKCTQKCANTCDKKDACCN